MKRIPAHTCPCGLNHIYVAHSAYQAARMVGLSRATILRVAGNGIIGKRIGARWHFTQHDLEKERRPGRPRKET